MDGNKDEAAKCLRIGKEALQSGDRSRALKFLSKARRLDPSLPVDALLSAASAAANSSPPPPPPPDTSTPTSSSSSSSGTADAATARAGAGARARARARASASASSPRSYTEEQAAIVRQIKIQKDYYQILGVEKGCTVEDLRRAYRKLSLKVHPDKNQAPGAEEAFKAVSKAFQCLSDDDSRKSYDINGYEEPALRRAPARQGSHRFNGFYEADFDADEIFRNFFYSGTGPATATPFGTFHFRTGGMGARGMHGGGGGAGSAASNSKLVMLLQILPIILLMLLNFLPSSDPPYSLSRTYYYGHKLQTPRGVPYFVKSATFEEKYPFDSPQLAALEQSIEMEYVGLLRQSCRTELQRRRWGWDEEMVYCNMLRKFETVAA